MTDNEKRAHDLAVAFSVEFFRMKSNNPNLYGMENTGVDIYKEYINIYDNALESFNKHFPNGK